MRLLSAILLVFMMGLLMVPCSDLTNSCDNSQQIKTESSHSHSQDQDDTCSPFCLCSCCGITMTAFHFHSLDLAAPIHFFLIKHQAPSDFDFISQGSASVWQPPKPITA
ncbi:DUF6660 family protein [Sphingobacterium tabacisoli]|uniref:DUF6660 family protein n=1 Tax=Sphingobacterium tabacisoli TaxID=2044855 RepID=A0ABW5L1R3_9SPHI